MALVHERAAASRLRLAPVSMERATCFLGGAWQGTLCLRGWPSGGCRSHHGHNNFDSLHNPERVERTSPAIASACLWENGGVIFERTVTYGAQRDKEMLDRARLVQRVREIADGSGPCVGETNPMLGEPTRSGKKAHEITHVSAASWCLTCLHCKSRDDPCTTAVTEKGAPRLQAVFCFLKEDIDWIAPTNTWMMRTQDLQNLWRYPPRVPTSTIQFGVGQFRTQNDTQSCHHSCRWRAADQFFGRETVSQSRSIAMRHAIEPTMYRSVF